MTRKPTVKKPDPPEPEPCKHVNAHPIGNPDADGSQVWYCPDPPKGCGRTIGKKPRGWKPNGVD